MGVKTHAIEGEKLCIEGEKPQEMKTSSWEVTTRTSEGVKTYL
jgi:hypothetical protein